MDDYGDNGCDQQEVDAEGSNVPDQLEKQPSDDKKNSKGN